MNDLSPTPTRYTTERPICVAILAVGGQGGGVLSDWIVALAESRGWHVSFWQPNSWRPVARSCAASTPLTARL
jgi:hypothetical protein